MPDDVLDQAEAATKEGGGVSFSVEADEEPSAAQRAKRISQPATPSKDNGAGSYDELMSRMGSTEGAGRQGGTQLVPEELKSDVDKLNRRMKNMNRCLLDPRSKFMSWWDFFTLFALFFTLIITPFEVALLPTKGDFLFFFNWFINLIFIVDMVVNFILPYKESAKQGGGTVKSHKKIAHRYLTSWFPIDLISILPFDSVEVFAEMSSGASPFGDSGGTLKIIKMIRLLRLLKLARILRASRIFSRWENELGMSYQKMELIKWSILIFCVMHLLACGWALLAQLQGSLREADLSTLENAVIECTFGTDCVLPEYQNACPGCLRESTLNGLGYDEDDGPWPQAAADALGACDDDCLVPCEMQLLSTLTNRSVTWLEQQENWKCREQTVGKVGHNHWQVYFASLYVAILQVGGGVGSICPSNVTEYIFVTVALLAGSTVWALIVGTICGIVATGDPHATEFKQKMDELNYFMTDMNIDQTLRVRAREYYRQTRDLRKKLSYTDLIDRLSPTLRGEVVLQMSKKTLETVWYLRACEPYFLVELALVMVREGYAPREKIPSEKLNIVMRGVAAKAGNILTYGDHWGEDMIVSSRALRDLRNASALTYVEVGTISRDDLEAVLEQFPASEREIRQSAMKIAMQRAIVVISEFVRMQQSAKSGSAGRLDKLAGVFAGGPASVELSEDAATDPSTILNIITGGKLKDIDEEGNIIEEEDDEADMMMASPSRMSRARGASLDGGGGGGEALASVLKELRDVRKEMQTSMEAMRREISNLKTQQGV